MLAPIIRGMEICLTSRGPQDLIPEPPWYVAFCLELGMVQHCRVDDARDKSNPYGANLISRHMYDLLNRRAAPDTRALTQLSFQRTPLSIWSCPLMCNRTLHVLLVF